MGKKIWMAGLAAAVMLAGTSLAVYAQEDQAASGGNGRPAMGMMGGGMMNGGMMCGGGMDGKKMGPWKKKLGLSDEQASKLKELFRKQREETRPLRDQMGVDMALLRQKVDQKAPDSELRNLLDKLDRNRRALQADRQKMADNLREILTPTQQAKMLLGMRERCRRMAAECGMAGKWKGRDGAQRGRGGKMAPPRDASGNAGN